MAEALALAKCAMSILPKIDIKGILTETKQVDIQKKTHRFQCKLGASYGYLTSSALQKMDEALKVCIKATIRAINDNKNSSWSGLVACMMNNPVLKHNRSCDVMRLEKYTVKDINWFKFDGSPDCVIVNEVDFWLKQLICDKDIITDLRIDKKAMAEIVAQTGARIRSIKTLLCKTEYTERTILDAGILRYPDLDHPYFMLYRIELKAWSHCSRVLMRQEDRNGIIGEFKCMQFKPRQDVIAKLTPEIREKAAAEAVKLLNEEM